MEPDLEKTFEDYDLGLISMDFGDSIEVVEAYLSADELTDLSTAIEQVTKDQEKNEVYEVKAGDTLSGISFDTNIPLDRLIELNESLDDENSMIRVGDELIITVPEPELTVERKEEMYYEEDYEEEIIYIDNDDWYTTERRTLQEPSAGHRKVVAIVSFENDKQVAKEIIKEEVTYQAVAKIVERGTKIPPTYIKPISGGRLSSNFGRRTGTEERSQHLPQGNRLGDSNRHGGGRILRRNRGEGGLGKWIWICGLHQSSGWKTDQIRAFEQGAGICRPDRVPGPEDRPER